MKGANFPKFSKAQLKSMTLLTVSLSVSVLLIAFLILPWVGEISRLMSDIKIEDDRNKKLKAKEKQLAVIDQEEISKNLSDLTAALPNEKEIPALVSGVTRLSQESGLTMEGMQINPGEVSTPSAKPKEDVEFILTLKGSPEALKGFLSNLERAKRLISVKDLSASIFGDSSTFTVSLGLKAPFESFAPPPEDVSTPLPEVTSEQEKVLAEINKFTDYTIPVAAGATGKQDPFRD